MSGSSAVRLRGIEWTASLSGFFPWLRPETPAVLDFAEQAAADLGPNDGEVPLELLEEGVVLLGTVEKRRLVAGFAARHPDQWAAVCSDVGDVPALERSLVAGTVRAAILERRLPPVKRLSDLEHGVAPTRSPRDVLAVTLPAEAVWSVVDMKEAETSAERAETERVWLASIMTVASARIHDAHPVRVQRLAAALRRRLPADGFPAASRLLDDGYGRAEEDVAFAEQVALALLPVYVSQRTAYIVSEN